MPKASINEDRQLLLGKQDVGRPPDMFNRPGVHLVPKTTGMQNSTDGDFGSCSCPAITAHDP